MQSNPTLAYANTDSLPKEILMNSVSSNSRPNTNLAGVTLILTLLK